jgi:hypothetical protein
MSLLTTVANSTNGPLLSVMCQSLSNAGKTAMHVSWLKEPMLLERRGTTSENKPDSVLWAC